MKLLAICITLGCFVGCASAIAGSPIDIVIENRSSNDINNAKARFGNYRCSWGFVAKSLYAINIQYPHPITQETELHWDVGGEHKMQTFNLKKIYPIGKSGELRFVVYDNRAEVNFYEKPISK